MAISESFMKCFKKKFIKVSFFCISKRQVFSINKPTISFRTSFSFQMCGVFFVT